MLLILLPSLQIGTAFSEDEVVTAYSECVKVNIPGTKKRSYIIWNTRNAVKVNIKMMQK